MTRRECPAMRAPTSFFLSFVFPFFASLSYFIFTCVLQSIFLVTKMEKNPASLAANSTLDQCTELKQVLIIHWRGSAKFIVVLHQCNMNSKKHSWKFLMVKSQIEMHFWHTKLATEANLSAKWETLLNLNFHSYFEANSPNCIKVLC